jgi:hypothetical protein
MRILRLDLHEKLWDERILDFLQRHPASLRLAVVQHLWPEFLGFPAERRAHVWQWVKERLDALQSAGTVVGLADRDGIITWSIRRGPGG